MTIARQSLIFLALLNCGFVLRAAETVASPTIHMVGDSTMANRTRLDEPERGWGQLFPEFVIAPATVKNHALNGRSSKSFIDEGHWVKVSDSLKPGDWVIIQFGHNDQKSARPELYTDPKEGYRDNLRRFITETRARSAHPIIATSVVRRHWDKKGEFFDTLGGYPQAAREVAKEEEVALLDLHKLTFELESDAGVEGSKRFHFKGDDSHYSEAGARAVAALAADEVRRLKLPLTRWIRKKIAKSSRSSAASSKEQETVKPKSYSNAK